MSNVIEFPKIDDADDTLKEHLGKLKHVVIIGVCKDEEGGIHFASTYDDKAGTLWLLECAKDMLMTKAREE